MNLTDQFTGMTALVSGAGTGMGAAIAHLLAERGANVVLLGRRAEPLDESAAAIDKAGGSALAVPTDVSDPLAVQDAVDVAVAHFGALHLAVNNAGIASESVDIQPGVIATPMLGPDSGPIAAQVPGRRIGEPSEIATAVAFLLSGDASYVTGAHLAVDGGFLG